MLTEMFWITLEFGNHSINIFRELIMCLDGSAQSALFSNLSTLNCFRMNLLFGDP